MRIFEYLFFVAVDQLFRGIDVLIVATDMLINAIYRYYCNCRMALVGTAPESPYEVNFWIWYSKTRQCKVELPFFARENRGKMYREAYQRTISIDCGNPRLITKTVLQTFDEDGHPGPESVHTRDARWNNNMLYQ